MADVSCSWCGAAVDPERDDHIQAECSVEACGTRTYHVECIQECLKSGRVDTRTFNTSAALATKAKVQNCPQEVIKRRPCPVGRDKTSDSNDVKPCSGMVLHSSYHAHKKVKKKAAASQPMPSVSPFPKSRNTFVKQHAVNPARKEDATDTQSRRLHNLHNNLQNVACSSNPFASLHENGSTGGPRRGKKLRVLLADNAKWSQEQIDFAIKEGRLSPGFRMRLCSSINGEEPCRLGSQCQNAHSPAELRVKAAIEMGFLPHDYKTAFCEAFLHSGECEDGMECMKAHNLCELRVLAAIQMGLVDPAFKTSVCAAYEASQDCQWGELCTHAHGRKQLRAEAAVQLCKLAADFKTSLCDMWCLEGHCSYGCQCPAAHGVSDMRIQAAINAGTVMDVYKTQRCLRANCKRLHCTYSHDESDQLPLIGYKAQYCLAYQETGQCPYGTQCHFAHDSCELVNVDISVNFVTRSIESEDTESILSTETAESRDVRSTARDARAGGAVVPLAVSSGKMPVAAPKTAVKQRRRKGGPELRLCKKFQESGNCTDPNCSLAHGADELNRRQEEAMGESRQAMPTSNSANVPAPRVFSSEVLEAIQTYKLSACVEQLKFMGFSFDSASKAARIAAGDADLAIELLTSGQLDHAGIPETTVQAEVDELCCIANALNISTADTEAAVLKHYGNHHEAMKIVHKIRTVTQDMQAGELYSANPKAVRSNGPHTLADPSDVEADSDADEFVAMERSMWADVRRPTWEEGSHESSSTVSMNPGKTDLPDYPQKVHEEAPESQPAAEETAWQEYRPEDFGIDVAAGQAGHEEEDELLSAVIQASKADALAEEASFMSAHGGGACRGAADDVSTGPALKDTLQKTASHRAWFPPAETFASKADLSGPTSKGAGQQEADPGMQKEGTDDTYSDVMSFLLGS